MKIAIYDLDRTVTKSGTYTRFLLLTAMTRTPWRILLFPAVLACALAYKAGLIDRKRLKEIGFRVLLGRSVPRAEMAGIAASFARNIAKTGVFPGAISRMNADRRDGYQVILATASPEYYVRAIADELDVGAVIATQHDTMANGDILSTIKGENCYGTAKCDRVKAWFRLQEHAGSATEIRFYSDDVSDEPTLRWVDQPFVVNPGIRERALALRMNWPMLSFTDHDAVAST